MRRSLSNFIDRNIESIYSLSLLKLLKLNAIAPLVGYSSVIRKDLTIHETTKYLLMIAVYFFLQGIYFNDFYSLARVGQFAGIALLYNYLIFQKIDIKKLINVILFIGIVHFIYDLITNKLEYSNRLLPFLDIYRLKGITGEYNYSSAVYLSITILSLTFRNRKAFLASSILLLTTGSRSAFIIYIFSIFLYLFSGYKKMLHTAFMVILMYPIFILSTFHTSENFVFKVNQYTSKRLSVQRNALRTFKKNPLGVGYFRGRSILGEMKEGSDFKQVSNESHNLIIQVLLQGGVVGIVLFYVFLIRVYLLSHKRWQFVSILGMFMSLNGLHELSLYLIMAKGLIVPKEELFH